MYRNCRGGLPDVSLKVVAVIVSPVDDEQPDKAIIARRNTLTTAYFMAILYLERIGWANERFKI